MILVMAGNYHQFRYYLKKLSWSPNECRYLVSEDHLRGFNGTVVRVGTWFDNPNYTHDVMEQLYYRVQTGRVILEDITDENNLL